MKMTGMSGRTRVGGMSDGEESQERRDRPVGTRRRVRAMIGLPTLMSGEPPL